MRYVLALCLLASLTLPGHADSGEKWTITNDRNVRVGDIYDPGHGRRLQLRDARGNIRGYIERDGTLTDTRRRKLGTVEDVRNILKED